MKKLVASTVLLCFAFNAPSRLSAQETTPQAPEAGPPKAILMGYRLQHQLGKSLELRTRLSEHLAWLKENQEPWSWATYSVVTGEHLGGLVCISERLSLQEMDDAQEARLKAQTHFSTNVAGCLAAAHGGVYVFLKDHSIDQGEPQLDPLLSVTTYTIKPSHHEEFLAGLKAQMDAISESDNAPRIKAFWLASGGSGEILVVTPAASWAQIGQNFQAVQAAIAQMDPAEKQKMQDAFQRCVAATKTETLALSPDLCYAAEGAPTLTAK